MWQERKRERERDPAANTRKTDICCFGTMDLELYPFRRPVMPSAVSPHHALTCLTCCRIRCDGEGRIIGGLAAIPGFGWWPIKAYKPCSGLSAAGMDYVRWAQTTTVCNSNRQTSHGEHQADPPAAVQPVQLCLSLLHQLSLTIAIPVYACVFTHLPATSTGRARRPMRCCLAVSA